MYSTKQVNKSNVEVTNVNLYPIQVVTDKQKIKEYHLKKLYELSKLERSKLVFKVDGSIWKDDKPITEEPSYEQKEWFVFRMTHSNTWPKVRENKTGDYKNWI